MQRISEYRFHQVEPHNGVSGGIWIAEASELGFPAGVWPEKFAIVPVVGDEVVFEKSRQIQGGGFLYENPRRKMQIEVLND